MIIMLFLDTGMRIGECLKITVKDLDIEERTIFLPAENTKGGTSRYVFFSMKTCKNLQRWLQFKDRYCNSKFLFILKTADRRNIRRFRLSTPFLFFLTARVTKRLKQSRGFQKVRC